MLPPSSVTLRSKPARLSLSLDPCVVAERRPLSFDWVAWELAVEALVAK